MPTLIYGSEAWPVLQIDISKTQASKMTFLRAVRGCSFRDYLLNNDIRKDLKVSSVVDRVKEYRHDCRSHVELMVYTCIRKQVLKLSLIHI